MNRIQKILGIALLVGSMVALAFALAEIAPSTISSIGWQDLASVGWVTIPL